MPSACAEQYAIAVFIGYAAFILIANIIISEI